MIFVVASSHLKYISVKLNHLPKFRGENEKYLKPPTSCVVVSIGIQTFTWEMVGWKSAFPSI